MVDRNENCPWRVVLGDQDGGALDRLLENTSKLVLGFGCCVGSLCSAAVVVARNITLPLRRNDFLGCVRTLHDGHFKPLWPKWATRLQVGLTRAVWELTRSAL